MSKTPNLNLLLTPEDDTSTTFKAWRVAMNGEDENSNMAKIDEAYGALNDQTQRIQSKVNTVSDKVFGEAPTTWADVQTIVRNGAAAQYFDIGDQFIVEKLSAVTASKGTSTGITAVTVNADTFVAGCGEVHAGEYVFAYDGKSWRNENGKTIKIANYGIGVTGTPVTGDHVIITETTSQYAFDVIGIDHDTPADPSRKHSMTLQMHDLWPTAMQYDAPEAMYYIDEETYPNGLEAGTYYFTLPNYDASYGGGSTLNFTLANPVPVGGQIRFGWGYQVQANTCKISTYESAGAATAIETVTVAEGEAGIALPALHATSVTENANCAHRIKYGSNNWETSALRQWLNSDAEGGKWWEPKTVFDRPSTNAATAGFLKGLDPAFLNIIGDVTKTTQQSISDGYGLDASTERFFLLSRPEIYAGTERSADGADGKVYAYYGAGYSDLASPGTGADSNRIKYRSGSATYWWLRTPYSTYGSYVRHVYPAGDLSSGSANGSYGVAPACVIV